MKPVPNPVVIQCFTNSFPHEKAESYPHLFFFSLFLFPPLIPGLCAI